MARLRAASVAWRALRYRAGQSVALLLLSAVGVAACAFGPLYVTAIEQAQTRQSLSQASVSSRGVVLRGYQPAAPVTDVQPGGRAVHLFGPGLAGSETAVGLKVAGKPTISSVFTRTGACAHLHFTSGTCPTGSNELATSTTAAKLLGLAVGGSLTVAVLPNQPEQTVVGIFALVGLYEPVAAGTDYWFGHQYTSATGGQPYQDHDLNFRGTASDAFLSTDTAVAAMQITAQRAAPNIYIGSQTFLDLPLNLAQVQASDLAALSSAVAALQQRFAATGEGVTVSTDLPALITAIDAGRTGARTIVFAFALELILLVLVVLGIVVVAGTDLRQPEFALAQLRGWPRRRSLRLFVGENAVLLLASVWPGLGVAWVACWSAGRWWLDGQGGPRLSVQLVAVVAALVLVELGLLVAIGLRSSGRPVHEMLRRVPRPAAGHGVSALEVAVAATALAGVIVVLSGDGHSAVAVLAPAMIALLAGLVLSRVLAALAGVIGRRALWRGRIALGLSALQVGRRSGTRRVVVLLCVAVALVVSAADQRAVSERNRQVRAIVEAGAPVVLTVQANSAAELRSAVLATDPTQAYATPVLVHQAPDGSLLVAAEPRTLDRTTDWGWPGDRPAPGQLGKLVPANRPNPIQFAGTDLTLQLSDLIVSRGRSSAGATAAPISLSGQLQDAGGQRFTIDFGRLPERGAGRLAVTRGVACRLGCRIAALQLVTTAFGADQIRVRFTVTAAAVTDRGATRAVPLGPARDWASASPSSGEAGAGRPIALTDTGAGWRADVTGLGQTVVLQHLDVPVSVPSMRIGANLDGDDPNRTFYASGIDGQSSRYLPVGTLRLLPGAPKYARLVDLDLAIAASQAALDHTELTVRLDRDDRRAERRLTAALATRGVVVISRDTAARHRAAFAASGPGWAMRITSYTTVFGLLIALLLILVSAAITQRSRASDGAALRLVGLSRSVLLRSAIIEQLVAVSTATALGSVMGVLGARIALPALPMFLTPTDAPDIELPIAWAPVLISAAAALLVLGASAALVAHRQVPALGRHDRAGSRP